MIRILPGFLGSERRSSVRELNERKNSSGSSSKKDNKAKDDRGPTRPTAAAKTSDEESSRPSRGRRDGSDTGDEPRFVYC